MTKIIALNVDMKTCWCMWNPTQKHQSLRVCECPFSSETNLLNYNNATEGDMK